MARKSILALAFILTIAGRGRAADIDVDDLRPGLVTTHRDAAQREIMWLEPTIAMFLKAGESAHPRLDALGGGTRWEGYVNVLRPGNYRFNAVIRGRFQLRVADKEALNIESTAAAPVLQEGPEVRLETGIQPLSAVFTRLPGIARLELFWQAAHFRKEPLPHDPLGHLPAQVPVRLAVDLSQERGRFLAEERNCIGCHQAEDNDRLAKTLTPRQAPDLSHAGERIRPNWIYHWLGSPRKVRPGAVMPRLFGDDEIGRAERYAVARYLESLGGPVPANAKPVNDEASENSRKRGEQLFTQTGCIACHSTAGPASGGRRPADRRDEIRELTPPARRQEMSGMGSKTTPAKLAVFLANPLAVNPSGRMPNMLLKQHEALDLAIFLCHDRDAAIGPDLPETPRKEALRATFQRVDPRPDEWPAFEKLKPDVQWIDLGKRLVIDKSCNSCHTIEPDGKPFAQQLASASFDDLKETRRHTTGCLTDDTSNRGKAPAFDFDEADRKALRLFLKEGTTGAGSPAPSYSARIALERFNCVACHSRDGAGGLSPELIQQLRRYEKAAEIEAISPPTLAGVGHKLRTPWLKQVLTQGARARPWMGLRMPQFGEKNVAGFAEALATLEGAEPDDIIHQVPMTDAKIEIGRRLIGKNAMSCISCHDLAGVVNTNARGTDLASINQRVRYDWYRRWLEQPQRMQPGTRMPTVFPDGKSLLGDILGGSADAQAEALWAYLSLGLRLPLPDGLQPPRGK